MECGASRLLWLLKLSRGSFCLQGDMKQAVCAGVELGVLSPPESELFLTSVVLGPATELL